MARVGEWLCTHHPPVHPPTRVHPPVSAHPLFHPSIHPLTIHLVMYLSVHSPLYPLYLITCPPTHVSVYEYTTTRSLIHPPIHYSFTHPPKTIYSSFHPSVYHVCIHTHSHQFPSPTSFHFPFNKYSQSSYSVTGSGFPNLEDILVLSNFRIW